MEFEKSGHIERELILHFDQKVLRMCIRKWTLFNICCVFSRFLWNPFSRIPPVFPEWTRFWSFVLLLKFDRIYCCYFQVLLEFISLSNTTNSVRSASIAPVFTYNFALAKVSFVCNTYFDSIILTLSDFEASSWED